MGLKWEEESEESLLAAIRNILVKKNRTLPPEKKKMEQKKTGFRGNWMIGTVAAKPPSFSPNLQQKFDPILVWHRR